MLSARHCHIPLLVALGSAPLAAQTPEARAALDALRDSLAAPMGAAPQPSGWWSGSGPVARIAQGLILLREGESGARREPYDAAVYRIEQALDAEDNWPYPWYALGVVRLALSRRGFVAKATPYHPAGTSYRRAAMEAFAEAIRRDSSFVPAADALGGLLVAFGHRRLPLEFAAPLRAAIAATGGSPSTALALFRLDYLAGRHDAARDDLAGYLRTGGDSGLADLESARLLEATGDSAAAPAAYVAGLARAGSAGRSEYRDDFAWVATDAELHEFDRLPDTAMVGWARRFWLERDVLALRRPGERLAEHLRRWVYVQQNYLIERPDDVPIHAEGLDYSDQRNVGENFGVINAMVLNDLDVTTPRFKVYQRRQWEIDDRGVIYLRHGPPTRVAFYPPGPPNVSWEYDLPEGSRVFHFLGSHALGTTAATTLVAALPLEPGMLDSRGNLDPRYTEIASDLQRKLAQVRNLATTPTSGIDTNGYYATRPGSAAASVAIATIFEPQGGAPHSSLPPPPSTFRPEVAYKDILRGRAAIAAGVTTDGFPQHFKRDLGAVVQIYGFGPGAGDQPRLLVVFAVPGRELTSRTREDGGAGVLYPVALRVVALDREQGLVRQLDTVRTFLAHDTLNGAQQLTGYVELPVPSGAWQVRALVTEPGLEAATAAGRDSVVLTASPDSLTCSDLVLGRTASGLAWSYEGTRVPLNPLDAYPEGQDAELFYQAGGLVPGRAYVVQIAIRQAHRRSDGPPAYALGIELTAEGSTQRVHRTLGLSNLRPGRYLLQMTLRERGTDRSVSREQELNILDQHQSPRSR